MVKINSLEVHDVKKVKAVALKPTLEGLTVIGGRSEQGKTSVLDAIVWALGGDKYRPSSPGRTDADSDPSIKITLDNGLIVERSGKNSSLKVTDSRGMKAGQSLLNELISQLAIDLPKFLHASGKEKAEMLLHVIGVGDELKKLDTEAKAIYDRRQELGRDSTRAKKHADTLPVVTDAPGELLSSSELIQQQQAIAKKNEENNYGREQLRRARCATKDAIDEADVLKLQLRNKELSIEQLKKHEEHLVKYDTIEDESDAEIVAKLEKIDELNQKFRDAEAKRKACDEARELQNQYDDLSKKLNGVREARQRLLDGADLPLPGLSVIDGELIYNGQKWDCMSGTGQLRVGVAIARQLKPGCDFVLVDKAEQMDLETLKEFAEWAESEGLQVIATRVSTGDECSIIIEDGIIKDDQ
jgi:chromosome segregation ATPase